MGILAISDIEKRVYCGRTSIERADFQRATFSRWSLSHIIQHEDFEIPSGMFNNTPTSH
jgi:hypothetical protein